MRGCDRGTVQGRQNWNKPPNKSGAGTLFWVSDISGCRSNLPLSSRCHLYPSFCWTQLNDVPGDKQWLTTSRQDTRQHRHGCCVHVGVYTARTARTVRPAAASFANCVPQTWGRYMEQMWLHSVWQAWEKKAEACRLVTTQPVCTCFSIVALIRPSSAANSQGPSLVFCRNYPFLFVFLPKELNILVLVLNSSSRNQRCNCTLAGWTHASTSAIFDRLSVNTQTHVEKRDKSTNYTCKHTAKEGSQHPAGWRAPLCHGWRFAVLYITIIAIICHTARFPLSQWGTLGFHHLTQPQKESFGKIGGKIGPALSSQQGRKHLQLCHFLF